MDVVYGYTTSHSAMFNVSVFYGHKLALADLRIRNPSLRDMILHYTGKLKDFERCIITILTLISELQINTQAVLIYQKNVINTLS